MTRGKHGAAAAKRRAESAEEQLDRLLPKLVDAERQLKMCRSEAEAAPTLRRELSALRKAIGVPKDEHDREVAELERKHTEAYDTLAETIVSVMEKFKDEGAFRHPVKADWINARLMRDLQALPRETALALLKMIGVERDLARYMLEPVAAAKATAEGRREALNFQRMAAEVGVPDGKIPRFFLDGLAGGGVDEAVRAVEQLREGDTRGLKARDGGSPLLMSNDPNAPQQPGQQPAEEVDADPNETPEERDRRRAEERRTGR